jgi:hypothetical protein
MVREVVLVVGVLGGLQLYAADQPAPSAEPQRGSSTLSTQEEDSRDGRRVRVTTPTVLLRSSPEATLGLRVECLHPVGSRPEPKQCLVYVVHTAAGPKYSREHNTLFQVEADEKKVFDSNLSNFGANPDGNKLVEPLVGFWDFAIIKTLGSAHQVTFTLAGERIAGGQQTVDVLHEMVNYFAPRAGV